MRQRILGVATPALATVNLALFCGAVAVQAQTLSVQTGDHDDFTRLVIPVGEDRDWRLDGSGEQYQLSLLPGIDGFNLSGSFDLIQRTRIADLTEADGALTIDLACACNVSSFRYLDRFLVIDVADPDPNTEASPPTPTRAATDDPRAAERAAAAAALPDLASILTNGPSVLGRGPETAAPPMAEAQQPSETPASNATLEEAAHIMAEQLARAAAAGLLEPAVDAPLAFGDPLSGTENDAPAVSSTAPTPPPPPTPETPDRAMDMQAGAGMADGTRTAPDLPLRAQNALDVSQIVASGLADTPTPRLACTGQTQSMLDWSVSEDFSTGLGELRNGLFDERDRLVDAAARDLAKHYLFYGFGAEAEFWMAQMANPPAELRALAQLIENDHPPAYPIVSDASICSDDEFLLRYLGRALDTALTNGQANRLQRGFAALPPPLQTRLGPMLARRLSEDGQTSTARNIRDALHRSGRLPNSTLLTLDMDLGVDIDPNAARDAISVALRDDGASPVPTMANALALDRTEGRRPDPVRVTSAMALLRETPPGPEADTLWREAVIAQARLGQIDDAIAMLNTGRERHGAIWQLTMTEVLADRLDANDSATLLLVAHLFGAEWSDGGSYAGRIRVATARQLRELGLVEAADQILQNGPGLILPQAEAPPPPERSSADLWNEGAWIEAARGLDGPFGELASRMARLEAEAASDQPPETNLAIDLDTLAQEVEDSGDLRDLVNSVLSSRLTDQSP